MHTHTYTYVGTCRAIIILVGNVRRDPGVSLWKAVITGDTVTRLNIPIRGRGKSPEEGQRWNLTETKWKKKQHKNYQRWGQKVRNK